MTKENNQNILGLSIVAIVALVAIFGILSMNAANNTLVTDQPRVANTLTPTTYEDVELIIDNQEIAELLTSIVENEALTPKDIEQLLYLLSTDTETKDVAELLHYQERQRSLAGMSYQSCIGLTCGSWGADIANKQITFSTNDLLVGIGEVGFGSNIPGGGGSGVGIRIRIRFN